MSCGESAGVGQPSPQTLFNICRPRSANGSEAAFFLAPPDPPAPPKVLRNDRQACSLVRFERCLAGATAEFQAVLSSSLARVTSSQELEHENERLRNALERLLKQRADKESMARAPWAVPSTETMLEEPKETTPELHLAAPRRAGARHPRRSTASSPRRSSTPSTAFLAAPELDGLQCLGFAPGDQESVKDAEPPTRASVSTADTEVCEAFDQDVARDASRDSSASCPPARGRVFGSMASYAGDFKFVLHEEWLKPRQASCRLDMRYASQRSEMLSVAVELYTLAQQSSMRGGDLSQNGSGWRRFVLHPDHTPHLCSLVVGCMFILFDAIAIPMAIFPNMSKNPLWLLMFTTVWWTFDFCCQFITGYTHNGVVEMRPSQIAATYAKSWMRLDLPLLVMDWFTIFVDLTSASDVPQAARAGAHLRSVRFVRFVRLLRLLRTPHSMKKFADLVSAEVLASARMFGLLGGVLLVSHYIACSWYGITRLHDDDDRMTWLSKFDADEDNVLYLYALGLHWSLTQFTPAPTDISPVNMQERFFAITVVLFGIFVFSSFIGSITAKIAEMRKIRNKHFAEESRVQEYLKAKNVSLSLSIRIWKFLRTKRRMERHHLREADVLFLVDLPASLQTCLRAEVHIPIISMHSFFLQIFAINTECVLLICQMAMQETFYKPLEEVFMESDVASAMHFIAHGAFDYHTSLYREKRVVQPSSRYEWVAEVALWGRWTHCGRLVASCSSEVRKLDCCKFRELVSLSDTHNSARRYAALLAELVQPPLSEDVEPLITDVVDDPDKVEALVLRAFGIRSKKKAMSFNSIMSLSSLRTVPSLATLPSFQRLPTFQQVSLKFRGGAAKQ